MAEQAIARGVIAVVASLVGGSDQLRIAALVGDERDLVDPDLGAGLEQHDGMFDHVLKLANVPGPGVRAQRPQRGLGERRWFFVRMAVPAPVMVEEIVGEHGDVFGALAQCRDLDRHDAQPVVQIVTQQAGTHRCFRVPIGGSDEAHVDDGVRFLAADATHDAVLDHPQ